MSRGEGSPLANTANRPGNIRWSGSNWSLTARIKPAPGISAKASAPAASAPVSTTTEPRAGAQDNCERSNSTNRAARSCSTEGSRQTYRIPAPAAPVTAGRTPALGPASATASSTSPSRDTQNDTLITVPDEGSRPHRGGAAGATVTEPPADASSSEIRPDRSATPGDVPSTSTPARSGRGIPGQSSSTAEGARDEPAAWATASATRASSGGPNSAAT